MVKRLLVVAAALFVAGLAVLAALVYRPDLPLETLERDHADLLFTEQSAFLSLPDGTLVHYREAGQPDAPTLILLHGSNASLHTWEPWVARLARDFRLLSVDLAGHGLTGPTRAGDYQPEAMDAFLLAFSKAVALDSYALAGNSWGGGIAWRHALLHPQRVTRLVLVAPAGLPPEGERREALVYRVARLPGLGNLMEHVSIRPFVRDALKAAVVDDALITPAMVTRYELLLRRTGNRQAAVSRLRVPARYPLVDQLGRLAQPTLILWGAEDAVLPVGDAWRFHEAIRDSTLVVLPGIGHLPQEEAPDETAALVSDFLRGALLPPAPEAADEEATSALPTGRANRVAPLRAHPLRPVEVRPLGPIEGPAAAR